MRPGIRIGVDVGTVRIGVARSDPGGILASPVSTVSRGEGDVAEVVRLAAELDALEIVIGNPIGLSGRATASTADAVGFAERLSMATVIPVRLVDERLSTVSATAQLRSSGRNSRQSRSVVDRVAAVIILQHALDFERSSDTPPGVVIRLNEGL